MPFFSLSSIPCLCLFLLLLLLLYQPTQLNMFELSSEELRKEERMLVNEKEQEDKRCEMYFAAAVAVAIKRPELSTISLEICNTC